MRVGHDEGSVRAELRRLENSKDAFATQDDYVAYIDETLKTLQKFDVIRDYHVSVYAFGVNIDIEIAIQRLELMSAFVPK